MIQHQDFPVRDRYHLAFQHRVYIVGIAEPPRRVQSATGKKKFIHVKLVQGAFGDGALEGQRSPGQGPAGVDDSNILVLGQGQGHLDRVGQYGHGDILEVLRHEPGGRAGIQQDGITLLHPRGCFLSDRAFLFHVFGFPLPMRYFT